MISECLQKDPSKRPTATELLKHPYFKGKAKDRKFLQQSLVASAPTIESRVQKAQRASKQRPGASGRLHRYWKCLGFKYQHFVLLPQFLHTITLTFEIFSFFF